MMNSPFGAEGKAAWAVTLTACAAAALISGVAGPAVASDRMVLCEEFTNKW